MAQLVVVDYNDLLAPASPTNALMAKLEQAFGPEGYGIIGIRNVPSFLQTKKECLELGHPLATLPPADLKALEDPGSLYNAGWSHGKEKLKKDVPDLAKASFYFNPVVDMPGTPQDRERYPYSYTINKWPHQSLPELEPAAKKLGCLMKDVSVHLAKHIDAYAHKANPAYPSAMLYDALKDTEKVKGRLLYYYPLSESSEQSEDSWIGFHNDSGFLTALAGDIYLDPNGNVLSESPSPNTGLYVEDRSGKVCKIDLPKDCMAIQMGECTQVISGGSVVATPHCVQGAPNLVRVSMACFIDTPPSTPLSTPHGCTDDSVLARTSKRVPPLADRWENGMTFGDFLHKTFEAYYSFND